MSEEAATGTPLTFKALSPKKESRCMKVVETVCRRGVHATFSALTGQNPLSFSCWTHWKRLDGEKIRLTELISVNSMLLSASSAKNALVWGHMISAKRRFLTVRLKKSNARSFSAATMLFLKAVLLLLSLTSLSTRLMTAGRTWIPRTSSTWHALRWSVWVCGRCRRIRWLSIWFQFHFFLFYHCLIIIR